jgi:hypothetical protein
MAREPLDPLAVLKPSWRVDDERDSQVFLLDSVVVLETAMLSKALSLVAIDDEDDEDGVSQAIYDVVLKLIEKRRCYRSSFLVASSGLSPSSPNAPISLSFASSAVLPVVQIVAWLPFSDHAIASAT